MRPHGGVREDVLTKAKARELPARFLVSRFGTDRQAVALHKRAVHTKRDGAEKAEDICAGQNKRNVLRVRWVVRRFKGPAFGG